MPTENRSTMEPARATDLGADSFVFTSESVTEGHPDKVADQISDGVLDAILAKEAELEAKGYIAPNGTPAKLENVRCACEAWSPPASCRRGEIRTDAYVDIQKIAREIDPPIGYEDGRELVLLQRLSPCSTRFDPQSADIAQGVDESLDVQGRPSHRHARPHWRRRPGHDVRLRVHNETPTLFMPCRINLCTASRAARRGPQVGQLDVPAPRRQDPGLVRYRTASRSPSRSCDLHAAPRLDQRRPGQGQERPLGARVVTPVLPEGLFDENTWAGEDLS